jgi:hypothetical protein
LLKNVHESTGSRITFVSQDQTSGFHTSGGKTILKKFQNLQRKIWVELEILNVIVNNSNLDEMVNDERSDDFMLGCLCLLQLEPQ